MIIVDDRLSLEVLAGRMADQLAGETLATTWGFHYRLVRALSDETRLGRLTSASSATLRRAALAPPSDLLVVLDPRRLTETAAVLAGRHRLNLLAAELFAAAKVHSARVMLSAGNVGRAWPKILASEGVELLIAD